MIKKSLKLGDDCEGNSGEEKLIIERNAFYNERLKDLRVFLVFSNFSCMVFQINGLLAPYNDSHFVFSCIYTLHSIVCIVIQLITFKNEKYIRLILFNNFIFLIRAGIRLVDFEDTF